MTEGHTRCKKCSRLKNKKYPCDWCDGKEFLECEK